MTCPCGESLKCIRRHPEKPARDEYRCDVCGRTFYRYQINEDW
jgi:predicted SprT family Zn-dependent metalloprotease